MLYSRLIDALLDECIAANLGGYDVEDILADRATGGDLIREILVLGVCDLRFKGSVRVAKAWREEAHGMLEAFAQELLDTPDLSRDEALMRLEAFLSNLFFQAVPMRGADSGDRHAQTDTQGRGKGKEEPLSREEERREELRFLKSLPPSLRKLARRIGRAGGEEKAPSGRFPAAAKSDIAGITVGDDLNSLLPSEIALLAGRETEDVFFRNFVGKRLQVFASASAGQEPVRRQDGPVVICLDRSGSMTGRPSDVARALAMAVTVYAKRRQRPVTILLYGNDEMDRFTVKNLRKQRKALVRFLSYDCGGGNNEEELFGTVFREIIPQDTAFSSADILCVSDFLWPPLSEAVREQGQGDEVLRPGRHREPSSHPRHRLDVDLGPAHERRVSRKSGRPLKECAWSAVLIKDYGKRKHQHDGAAGAPGPHARRPEHHAGGQPRHRQVRNPHRVLLREGDAGRPAVPRTDVRPGRPDRHSQPQRDHRQDGIHAAVVVPAGRPAHRPVPGRAEPPAGSSRR